MARLLTGWSAIVVGLLLTLTANAGTALVGTAVALVGLLLLVSARSSGRRQPAARPPALGQATRLARREARVMRTRLLSGQRPRTLTLTEPLLRPGEQAYVATRAAVTRWRAASWHTAGRGRSLLFADASLAPLAAFVVLSDWASDREAERQAQPQWRGLRMGDLVVTNQRLLWTERDGWHSRDVHDILAIRSVDPDRLEVQFTVGEPPARFEADTVASVTVVLCWILGGRDGVCRHPALDGLLDLDRI